MTNAEILASFARSINDAPFTKRSKIIQLGLLTDAMNYMIDRTECLRKIDTTGVLVASQNEIDVPSGFIKFPTDENDINRGFVAVGTSGKSPLTPITLTLLNNRFPNWRSTTAGTPQFYYLIKQGTPKLGFYPAPSAAWITANGSAVYIDMIYRAAAMADNSDQPFDDSDSYSGIFQIALKMRAIWQVKMEEMAFQDADRLEARTEKLIEQCIDFVSSMHVAAGNHGFEESMR